MAAVTSKREIHILSRNYVTQRGVIKGVLFINGLDLCVSILILSVFLFVKLYIVSVLNLTLKQFILIFKLIAIIAIFSAANEPYH